MYYIDSFFEDCYQFFLARFFTLYYPFMIENLVKTKTIIRFHLEHTYYKVLELLARPQVLWYLFHVIAPEDIRTL